MEIHLLNPLFIILLVIGVVFLITGAISKIFPPKGINGIYGYRTSSSMASSERWVFANRLSSNKMLFIGLIAIHLSLIGSLVSMPVGAGVFIALMIMFALVGWLLYSTEQAIKKKFGKQ